MDHFLHRVPRMKLTSSQERASLFFILSLAVWKCRPSFSPPFCTELVPGWLQSYNSCEICFVAPAMASFVALRWLPLKESEEGGMA